MGVWKFLLFPAHLRLLTANHTHARVTSEVIRGLRGDRWLQASFQVAVPQWAVRLSAARIAGAAGRTWASLAPVKGTFWQPAEVSTNMQTHAFPKPISSDKRQMRIGKTVSDWKHFRVANRFNLHVFAQREETSASSSQLLSLQIT